MFSERIGGSSIGFVVDCYPAARGDRRAPESLAASKNSRMTDRAVRPASERTSAATQVRHGWRVIVVYVRFGSRLSVRNQCRRLLLVVAFALSRSSFLPHARARLRHQP